MVETAAATAIIKSTPVSRAPSSPLATPLTASPKVPTIEKQQQPSPQQLKSPTKLSPKTLQILLKPLTTDDSPKLETDNTAKSSVIENRHDTSEESIIESSQDTAEILSTISKRRSLRTPATPVAAPLAAAIKVPIQNMDTLLMDTECVAAIETHVQSKENNASVEQTIPVDAKAICEMETEPNTEEDITQMSIEATMTIDKVIDEMDNNPNTEMLLSTVPESNSIVADLDSNDIDMVDVPPPAAAADEEPKSPYVSPEKNAANLSIILTSPSTTDIEARNAELLNQTINISPIHQEEVQTKSPETSSPPQKLPDAKQTMTPIISTTPINNRFQSSTPTTSSPSRFQFKGRGAQLLNMINNRKFVTPTKQALVDAELVPPPQQPQKPPQQTTDVELCAAAADDETTAVETTIGTPKPNKDLLTFSKVLPSPMASPSCSILKRKFTDDIGDSDFESPASKRKRVSFHDPPVSATKEYIGHADEHLDRNQKDAMLMHRVATTASAAEATAGTSSDCHIISSSMENARFKHILRRKSRADSMVELAKFENKAKSPVSMSSLKWDDESIVASTSCDRISLSAIAAAAAEHEEAVETPSTVDGATDDQHMDADDISLTPPALKFADNDAVLEHILNEYPLELLLERYIASGRQISANAARLITKDLSTVMQSNERVCQDTLEQLSENHSAQFLSHAIQENLGSVVCAQLTPTVMFEYLADQARNNVDIQLRTLQQATEMLSMPTTESADHAFTTERNKFMFNAVEFLADEIKRGGGNDISNRLLDILKSIYAEKKELEMNGALFETILTLLNQPLSAEQMCQCVETMARNRRN